MNYFKLTVETPEHWEKYSIIDANPELNKLNWFLHYRVPDTNTIVIETDDRMGAFMWAMSCKDQYNLQESSRIEVEELKKEQGPNQLKNNQGLQDYNNVNVGHYEERNYAEHHNYQRPGRYFGNLGRDFYVD